MRIGIDARELSGRPTGVGRYLSALLREWNAAAATAPAPHQFVLYLAGAPAGWVGRELTALPLTVRVVPGSGGSWWEQMQLPGASAADALDVLFAPAYTAPLCAGCPVVLTIHDLSYLAHPEWFRPRERWRRAWLTRASARRASAILTDSAFSGGEIQRLLDVAGDRVRVVPLGLGLHDRLPSRESRAPLVLFAGSIFNRRHVPDLVDAFAVVARSRPEARLVIVGENRTWPPEDIGGRVRALGLEPCVTLSSYVTDEELADLYARASAFVFLSEYEGFCLTPLEALAAGVPIVVADTPVAREVYEDAALYVGRGDIAATAAAIDDLLAGGPSAARVLAAAQRLLPRYSWPRAAAETLAVIEGAAR